MRTPDFMSTFQSRVPDKQELWEALRALGDVPSVTLFIDELEEARKRLLAEALVRLPQTHSEEDFSALNSSDYSSIATAALNALKVIVLRQDYEDKEMDIISRYFLPVCLASSRYSRSPIHKWLGFSQMGKHEARGDLAEWLNARAYQGHGDLRDQILRSLAALLRNEPVKDLRPRRWRGQELGPLSVGKAQAICWTISAIGATTPEVTESLQFVAHRRNDAGAVALTVLAGLGISPERNVRSRQIFEDWLDHCAREGRINRWLCYAMMHWSEPHDFALLHKSFSRPVRRRRARVEQKGPSKRRYSTYHHADLDDASQVLCEVAARYSEIPEWNKMVWETLLRWHKKAPSLGTSLFLGSSLSPRVNCEEIPGDFLTDLLPQTQEKSHPRSLVYMRLTECLLPRHIEGLLSLNARLGFQELWRLLADDALLQVGHPRLNIRTPEMMVKRGAWRILFSCGTFEGIARIEEGLQGESNGSTKASLLRRAAFFVFPQLPPTARALVEETVNLGGNLHEDDFIAHLAAQRLVCSQGTLVSLRLLLHFNLTWDGDIMMDTINAINQLAVEVARSGQRKATAELLFETAFGTGEDVQPHHRRAAISALRELSIYNQLHPEDGRRIVEFVRQSKLSLGQHSQLIEACGFALQSEGKPQTDEMKVEPETRSIVEEWLWSYIEKDVSYENHLESDVEESDGIEPEWRALAALVHCGWWQEDLPASDRRELFYRELNLIVSDGDDSNLTVHLVNPEAVRHENAFVLGLLFLQSPKVFEPVLLELLEGRVENDIYDQNNTFLSVARLLSARKQERNDSPRLGQALCRYVAQQQSDFVARPYWFDVLASYSSSALVAFNWTDRMEPWNISLWNTLSRSALARSVAKVASQLPESDHRKARDLAHVLALDSEFEVRRNAYRILRDLPADQNASTLERLMSIWSKPGQSQLQVELRQRAAEGAGWLPSLHLLDSLIHDPEKCVRDVARKSLVARQKRDRADLYLSKIIEAAQNTIIAEMQEISSDSHAESVALQLSPTALDAVTPDNRVVLSVLPYGEALSELGENQHIETLRDFSANHRLPGHVFYWLETIFTATQKQWDKTIKTWPKPWRDLRETEEALKLFPTF